MKLYLKFEKLDYVYTTKRICLARWFTARRLNLVIPFPDREVADTQKFR